MVHLYEHNTSCPPEENLLYLNLLLGVCYVVCLVNLWRFLGNNQQPQKQEVNKENKEEAKNGNAGKRSRERYAIPDQKSLCRMREIFHLPLVKCYYINITILWMLSRVKTHFLLSFRAGQKLHKIFRTVLPDDLSSRKVSRNLRI